MSHLIFTNPGKIDPISITTFGISAKDNQSAIGMFGTGLKYAIAVLLRNGYAIRIHSGGELYKFDVVENDVRNKTFKHVTMNDQLISFTTELGKFWEPWMAIRELACNAIDEHGSWELSHIIPQNEGTTIIVGGRNIEELYAESKAIFLDTKALETTTTASIHPGVSNWIYYRGIRAAKLEKPSLYTYNLHSTMTLTEDRTIKYMWDIGAHITVAVNNLENRALMTRIVSAPNDTFEGNLSYSINPTELMVDVVTELVSKFKSIPSSLKACCNASLIKALSEKDKLELDHIDQQRLDKAIAFAERIGFNVSYYPIIVTAHLGDNVLGRAVDDKIYISKRCFHMGTKMLVGTLIEEYLHLSEGVDDCTRGMQNLLFDTICSLGERITGETL